jgi:hypothetical protein
MVRLAMKKTILILTAVASLTISAQAGELFRIKPNTIVVGEALDLDELMTLNAQGKKGELRALYNRLKAEGGLVSAPSGMVVEVVLYVGGHFGDIAKIKWNGFSRCPFQVGCIAKSDLAEHVGSR